jgi:hypothetical protein
MKHALEGLRKGGARIHLLGNPWKFSLHQRTLRKVNLQLNFSNQIRDFDEMPVKCSSFLIS